MLNKDCITKITKRYIDFSYKNQTFRLNKHGVICFVSMYDGKAYYYLTDEERQLDMTYRQANDFVESLKVSSNHLGNIYK